VSGTSRSGIDLGVATNGATDVLLDDLALQGCIDSPAHPFPDAEQAPAGPRTLVIWVDEQVHDLVALRGDVADDDTARVATTVRIPLSGDSRKRNRSRRPSGSMRSTTPGSSSDANDVSQHRW